MERNVLEPGELISAFLDGEASDLEAVADALSAPGGCELLVDLLRLRAGIERDTARPRDEVRRHVERRLARRSRLRPVAAAAAAAVLVAVALVATVGIRHLRGPAPEAPSVHPVAVESPAPPAREEPPVPQRVIRFSEGVDWHRS